MPRPALPPTPGSSADIKAQDGSQQRRSTPPLSFELPPPAIHDGSRTSPADSHPHFLTPSHHRPPPRTTSSRNPCHVQPAEAVKAQRRSSAARESKGSVPFTLPPPPTRARKIIQMKPRVPAEAAEGFAAKDVTTDMDAGTRTGEEVAKLGKGPSHVAAGGKGKKKTASAVNAAGRKIARKTAHSLIERRRRSKMNDEFALLKSMIPACTGEMHKLAILQASIDYVRYLEDCVAKLKAQHAETRAGAGCVDGAEAAHSPLLTMCEFKPMPHDDSTGHAESRMEAEAASAVVGHHADLFCPLPNAPLERSHGFHRRQHSCSSGSTDRRHYSHSVEAATSPPCGPQDGTRAPSSVSAGSTRTSPALVPLPDLAQDATAALMLLNDGRRSASTSTRGLSVQDLLSS
ncbi:HLH transcription factor [Drechmeria coniospora]|uniref:HLH transcription factor n=1 Tax=Drechmeria coniospora TaxID=98403 RepID=A0A151GEH1_DRECN|nr:HLH transcription factor [Drechmeria coniospora]KYK55489.1 HLH transcription factor [Drechmeria coniospora]